MSDASTDPEADESGLDRETVIEYLQWGALFAFAVLALVAGAGIYSALGAIIDIWIADRFQPIARVGINVVVLCVAIAGALITMRRS
jgi:Ni/Fe-hydrogenase subunit HybB-like protein